MCQYIMDGNALKRRLCDCGMNFNVNTKTAACDLSRHCEEGARVAPRCNLFQPLSLGNLKVGFKRTEDYR